MTPPPDIVTFSTFVVFVVLVLTVSIGGWFSTFVTVFSTFTSSTFVIFTVVLLGLDNETKFFFSSFAAFKASLAISTDSLTFTSEGSSSFAFSKAVFTPCAFSTAAAVPSFICSAVTSAGSSRFGARAHTSPPPLTAEVASDIRLSKDLPAFVSASPNLPSSSIFLRLKSNRP